MRLVLKEKPREMTKAESFAYYQACEPREMFDVKETFLALPRKAEIFGSARCGCCGEMTGEKWLREAGGKKLCPDCLALSFREISIRKTSGHSPADLGSRK